MLTRLSLIVGIKISFKSIFISKFVAILSFLITEIVRVIVEANPLLLVTV